MNKFIFAACLLGLAHTAQSQHIPDANFANAIRYVCPTCIDGNDDLLPDAATLTSLAVSHANISDLTGIAGFTNLLTLNCGNNNLTSLPTLPSSLTTLYCFDNQFTNLPTLPSSLYNLDCSGNPLSNLPTLPNSLNTLICGNNQLSNLPTLPNSLIYLVCTFNQLISLPTLPNSLTYLNCSRNQLTSLPALPSSLNGLNCGANQLTSLPALPSSLRTLDCQYNQLSSLPTLPSSLPSFICDGNQLTSLPTLPSSLTGLYCSYNQLTNLPTLPSSLTGLYCSYNQLTNLPTLPSSLTNLGCNNNPITCLPFLPSSLNNLNIDTNITCLPNIPVGLVGSGFTICNASSPCFGYPQVQGQLYIDNDANSIFSSGDIIMPYQIVTGTTNFTGISDTNGNYSMGIDTSITSTCSYAYNPAYYSMNPASYSITTGNTSGQILTGNDFRLTPIGVANDLEVALTPVSFARPGFDQVFVMTYRNVGNTILSGTVDLTLDNAYQNLLFDQTPATQSGNTANWAFSNLQPFESRQLYATVTLPSSTILGTTLVNVFSGTVSSDANISNNIDHENLIVVGSFDPNNKTASAAYITPDDIAAGNQAITYTIRFQNTGTFPASFVEVRDTLDSFLDASSLRFLSESHAPVQISVNNDMQDAQHKTIIKWFFNNINLADSFSNEPASHGFVKFSVKPKTNLVLGNQIPNTAHIYFDYNAPVVTNTELVVVDFTSGVQKMPNELVWTVFPNPTEHTLNIEVGTFDESTELLLINTLGQIVQRQKVQNTTQQIQVQALPQGIYQLTLQQKNGVASKWIRKN